MAGRKRSYSVWRIFAAPLAIAVVSAVGLASALFGDNLWDALSWLALAAPAGVTVWCLRDGMGRNATKSGS